MMMGFLFSCEREGENDVVVDSGAEVCRVQVLGFSVVLRFRVEEFRFRA